MYSMIFQKSQRHILQIYFTIDLVDVQAAFTDSELTFLCISQTRSFCISNFLFSSMQQSKVVTPQLLFVHQKIVTVSQFLLYRLVM